ncbi:MAG: hypothetical protein OFPII_17460 [Osedax symbiont Rs1]|nr:MAG: hypothetical protein OFPII_17460 [Osedax symbiont Rs1]
MVKKSLKDWFYHRGHREHREEIKSIFCYGGDTGLIRITFDDAACSFADHALSRI